MTDPILQFSLELRPREECTSEGIQIEDGLV